MEARVWLLLCSLLIGVFAKEPSVSIEIKSKLTDIRDGNDVHLNCTTTDIQQNFTVGFRKDGMVIESLSYMKHRFTISSLSLPDGKPVSQLVQIHNFNNSTDTGEYECYAKTTSGDILASDAIFLSVLHFPDSLTCSPSGPVNVTQNVRITVSCTADRGFPIAKLQTNTTSPNNDSWMLTETGGKLVQSLDLILNTSDNGVFYQCLITSSQYFPNMHKHCMIGPISVLLPTASEMPYTSSTPLYTSTAIEGSASSTYSTLTNQPPVIMQSSVAVSVIVTLIVTVLLIIVITLILHRCGYWKWKIDKKWTQESVSEDDNTGINSTELQSQDNLVLIDDMVDPMYQELPASHTLPTSNIPRSVASQDTTLNNEIMPENIPPTVRPRMELPSTSEVQTPRGRALNPVDDVTYAHPIKKPKSADVNDSSKNKQLDFSHLYAKVKRKVSRKKQSRDNNNACVADVDSCASAHWTISFVDTSSHESPSADLIDSYIATTGFIFQTDEDETVSPEDETPYAEISFV